MSRTIPPFLRSFSSPCSSSLSRCLHASLSPHRPFQYTSSKVHGSWEGLDDVAKAGVGANYQAENPEKHQRHVLRNHYWPLRSVAHRPKCADLDDRGERQSQAREAQGAEQRYEEVQLGDRHGQQDCKKRTENRFNRRSVILLRLNVFFFLLSIFQSMIKFLSKRSCGRSINLDLFFFFYKDLKLFGWFYKWMGLNLINLAYREIKNK